MGSLLCMMASGFAVRRLSFYFCWFDVVNIFVVLFFVDYGLGKCRKTKKVRVSEVIVVKAVFA